MKNLSGYERVCLGCFILFVMMSVLGAFQLGYWLKSEPTVEERAE